MRRKEAMEVFLAADIYGITAEEYSLGRGNIQIVRMMLDAGIKVIQYREKEKSARQMFEECLAIRAMTDKAGAVFIVNDHLDIALAVRAEGVHVGQDDLPAEMVRQLIGEDMLLGLSTHYPAQAQAAAARNVVDYIGVGPIFATSTKKDVCRSVGLDYLEYVSGNIRLPFVAIGGIKEDNIAAVWLKGAKTIALVTEIVGAPDLPGKVQALRKVLAKITVG